MNIRRGEEALVTHRRLANALPEGIDYQSQRRFNQYIPLGALLRQQGGLLNLPVALGLSYDTASTPELSHCPGRRPVGVKD